MDFLNLLEEKINRALWKMIHLLYSLIPSPVKKLWFFFDQRLKFCILWIKSLPQLLLRKKTQLQQDLKSIIAEIDFKEKFDTVERKVKKEFTLKNVVIPIYKYSAILSHLVKRPFRDMTPQQGFVLVLLSISSLIAGMSIYLQSKRIYLEETKHMRTPASVEVIEFDRPVYYKQEFKQIKIHNLRIPVYYPQVNELQTVTIDFNISLSNRIGRVFIEKREFPIRDHLIQNLEPVLAKFSLDEEGKAIIKEKIAFEVQNFLDHHQIESEVTDVTLIYILAN